VQFAVAAVALLVTVATVALLEVAACVAKNAGSMPACEQKNGAAPKTGGRACAGRYLQPHTTTPESDGHACTRVLSFKDLDACNLTPPPSPMGMRVRVCYPSSGSIPAASHHPRVRWACVCARVQGFLPLVILQNQEVVMSSLPEQADATCQSTIVIPDWVRKQES